LWVFSDLLAATTSPFFHRTEDLKWSSENNCTVPDTASVQFSSYTHSQFNSVGWLDPREELREVSNCVVGNLISLLFAKYYYGNKNREGWIRAACRTHAWREICVTKFSTKTEWNKLLGGGGGAWRTRNEYTCIAMGL
jgi:hypothetical protein